MVSQALEIALNDQIALYGNIFHLRLASGVSAMNQSVKPPRILFVRPKSAGPVCSRAQVPSSLAPASRASETKTQGPLTPYISLAGSNLPQPFRPLNNTAKRPSSAVGSRRCFTAASVATIPLPKTARNVGNPVTCLWQQHPLDREASPELDVANIYHVVVARKGAEDAAQQLTRRIAHFRAQEERVLSEMQTMKRHLETRLTKTQKQPKSSVEAPLQTSRSLHLLGRNMMMLDSSVSRDATKQTEMSTSFKCKRRLKVPRSREQREFLSKQKRALEVHKLEVARQQKDQRKLALAEQKAKEAEQEHKRRCRKERIRAEEQQAIEQRIEKQRQLREAATKQHYERLMAEKQRQHEALNLVAEMEEEERNLRVRLEALHFHREYMDQELHGSLLPAACRTTGSD